MRVSTCREASAQSSKFNVYIPVRSAHLPRFPQFSIAGTVTLDLDLAKSNCMSRRLTCTASKAGRETPVCSLMKLQEVIQSCMAWICRPQSRTCSCFTFKTIVHLPRQCSSILCVDNLTRVSKVVTGLTSNCNFPPHLGYFKGSLPCKAYLQQTSATTQASGKCSTNWWPGGYGPSYKDLAASDSESFSKN